MQDRLKALDQLTRKGERYEIAIQDIGEHTFRVFKNAPANLRDIYEQANSDLPFIVFQSERLSFKDFWHNSCTLSAALIEEFGIGKGDRVAISMRNYPEWMVAFAAITSIGAIAVALNALWQPNELETALNNSGAKLLLADQERLDRLSQCGGLAPELAVIAVRADTHLTGGAQHYGDVLSRHITAQAPNVAIYPDDAATMLFTSGSTGNPKGAVSTHRNIIHALLSWELDRDVAIATGILPAPSADGPQSATLLAIPLFHVTGLHSVFLSSFRAQRKVIAMYKWDAAIASELIEIERISHFNGPAAVTGDLVEMAKHTKKDLSSLAHVGGGGAARASSQVKAIKTIFPNSCPGTGWGMTETNGIGTGIGGANYLERPESSGQVSALLDIRVVDEIGRELPPMQRGELQIQGVSIMRGYWNRPDANAEIFSGKWLRTGDVAYIDQDGFVYIVDRIKDLVIRGGENIGCGAVEAALLEHPAVIEAAVYGVADDRLGEEVGATVYGNVVIDKAELTAFLENPPR